MVKKLQDLKKDQKDIDNFIQMLEASGDERDPIIYLLQGYVVYDTFKDLCTLRSEVVRGHIITWLRHEREYLKILIEKMEWEIKEGSK